ncbi:hypothetical protein ACJX0J_026132, partial [Zea mays]
NQTPLEENIQIKRKFIPLSLFCVDLTMRARGGLIDHVIGHKEIERVTGVGKTTIIEGVALKIANGDVHIFLVNPNLAIKENVYYHWMWAIEPLYAGENNHKVEYTTCTMLATVSIQKTTYYLLMSLHQCVAPLFMPKLFWDFDMVQQLWFSLYNSELKIIMQWIFFLHRELSTLPEMDRAFINVLMITNMGLWELEKLNVIHLSLGKMMTIGSKIYKNFKMTLSKMTLSCVLQREYLGLVLILVTTFRDTNRHTSQEYTYHTLDDYFNSTISKLMP